MIFRIVKLIALAGPTANFLLAIALLTATHNRFPQDFWVTFELAWALNQERRRDEALGYFRAALALR
ncbi:MAG: hypothetical protein ABSF22_04800, partial [Bryobacteraceae bacterium]